jgi:hypothetical protein
MPLLPCIFLLSLSLSLSLSFSLFMDEPTLIRSGTEPVLVYDFSILIENYLEHRDFWRTPV